MRQILVSRAMAAFVAGLFAAALAVAAQATASAAGDRVVVASKIDTEGALLGNLIALLLERHGIGVEDRIQLGPTSVVRGAILAGQIDIYPEYTGNGGLFFRSEADPAWKDAARGYALVSRLDREKNHLVWLAPAPANNTWTIAVRKDLAGRMGGSTLNDFARYISDGGNVKLAASAEFVESPAALPSFEATYGFHLGLGQLLILAGGNTAATLRAAADGTSGVNAAMAYGTDGAVAALGLVTLADTEGAEVVYEPAPVVRAAVLARHPEMRSILDPVFRSLSLATLQRLNARIAVDGVEARRVAGDYLAEAGFLR